MSGMGGVADGSQGWARSTEPDRLEEHTWEKQTRAGLKIRNPEGEEKEAHDHEEEKNQSSPP
jgi:hypothetical protein